jgi:8-oxo-dGTP diphosphatase
VSAISGQTRAGESPLPHIDVACGVVVDHRGRVLLTQRPPGKIAAGKWEFPGGKIEPGETAEAALARELEEEVGIRVRSADHLLRFTHQYPERSVTLHCWRIPAFDGEASSRENQALRWWDVAALRSAVSTGTLVVLPTVAPILAALDLPRQYVFTPDDAEELWIRDRLPRLASGALLRLRLPRLERPAYAALATRLLPACRDAAIRLMLDRDPEMVAGLGAAGWHASERALRALDERPAALRAAVSSCHFAASVHDAESLALATQHRADFVVLGSVLPTFSHPAASTLGWNAFSALADRAGLPIFAIGGLKPADLAGAIEAGAFGVAGIRAFWQA